MADFAEREGGTVVNAAVNIFVHVDFLLGGNRIRLHAEDMGEHLTVESSAFLDYDGKLDLHKAALNLLPVTGGIEILSRSDAPPGSGLGGSGALDVALLAGLAHCRLESYEPNELAELGFVLEAGELGLLGGKQDQYAAALGGFNQLDFGQGSVRARGLSISEAAAQDLRRHLVLLYTGKSHFSSETHARVWGSFHGGNASVAGAIRAMRDVARQVGPVLESGDWHRLGELMDENWRNQQLLDATMFTATIRDVDQAVREAGAWGLKATGAGAGGCMAVICPPERRDAVANAARAHGAELLAYDFTFEGVKVWQRDDAAPHT